MENALVYLTLMATQEWSDFPDLKYFEQYPGQCILCACIINFTTAGTNTIESESKWNVSAHTFTTLINNNVIQIYWLNI